LSPGAENPPETTSRRKWKNAGTPRFHPGPSFWGQKKGEISTGPNQEPGRVSGPYKLVTARTVLSTGSEKEFSRRGE